MRGRNRREPAAAAGSERTTPRSPRWRLGCWRSMRPAGPEGRGLPRLRSLREGLARLWDARAWRPAHARLVWAQLVHRDRNRDAGLDDEAHLRAAARWLARAQDVMPDGGVAGRYRLCGGWTSSYPETTGYLIPTFQALGRALGDPRFEARAQQCVDFLLRLQLREGGFPGGEVHENTTRPSVFNTGQIVAGLTAWFEATGDGRAMDAARRAADWMVAHQDADGAWRRHVYGEVATTYAAHASCWLAELGRRTGARRYLDAAERHLDWVLRQRDPRTDWFDLAGFSAEDHRERRALTHTIAYTLAGVLHLAETLGRDDGVAAAAAHRIARRLELAGWLPGVLDWRWRGGAGYACLTGNAQMALVWMRLFRHTGDLRLVNAAFKAIDLVKRAQPVGVAHPDIAGAIPGSDPLWGSYLYCALPNWAAKFFVDALLAKQRVLAEIGRRPRARWSPPADVPQALPAANGRRPMPLRVVLYSSPRSPKVPQMVSQWSAWGFQPAAVVFERPPTPGPLARALALVRAKGLRGAAARVGARARALVRPRTRRDREEPPDPITFCRARRIPWFVVPALDSPEGRALMARLDVDLAVHAGAGILRESVLAAPRLGTLNAHMGLLPYYRGMNVAEWAALNGDPVGCSVHVVDRGIDTGPVVCVRPVDTGSARRIVELRRLVDEAQIALLGDVVRFVLAAGALPPVRPQTPAEGVQFFRLHPELAAVLEAELAGGVAGAAAGPA